MKRLQVYVFILFVFSIMGIALSAQVEDTISVRSYLPEMKPGSPRISLPGDIQVVFQRPVVVLTPDKNGYQHPAPIQFSPAITGQGEWINSFVYRFRPGSPMQPGTEYTVTLTDMQAADGRALRMEDWSFTTPLTEVTARLVNDDAYWQDHDIVLLDDTFTVHFSDVTSVAAIEANLRLETGAGYQRDIDLTYEENPPGYTKQVTVRPADPLQIASDYRLVIHNYWQGQRLFANKMIQRFTTISYPRVAGVNPEDASAEQWRGWANPPNIYFATPMNLETIRTHLRVEPDDVSWQVYLNEGLKWTQIIFEQQPDTNYRITLLAGAEDIYGNAIEEDYSWTYRYVSPPPETPETIGDWASLITAGHFMIARADEIPIQLPVRVSGDEDLSLAYQLYHMTPADFETLVASRYRLELNTTDEDEPESEAAALSDFEEAARLAYEGEAVFNGGGSEDVQSLVLDDKPIAPGLYFMPHNRGARVLAVANAVLTIKRNEHEILVLVTDMESAAPLPGMTVQVYREGDSVATATTDADGLARLAVAYLPGDERVFEYPYHYEYREDYLLVIAESADASRYGAWHTDGFTQPDKSRAIIHTDRGCIRV